ncbi:AlbA family DNA-binding domain-containing protein [Marinobacterium lutimaris]|uniref:Putative DNA-binding domain-containing protein n=1 Tax=Marinobacterium lutimaris TaxID=568106 RepID=A0A1H5U855_9GAMM|nr:ATP-binding protein [Marinobacterium lutimaris]SEF70447.1 Putative DNA-binding domain-containing protein [Marinobacterium lutimaris]
MKREYRRLSRRTQQLLEAPEGINIDFKREVQAVRSADLVAFANSPQGGTLLIGIDEYTSPDGVQRGRVVGCDVDDRARLLLVNKATECIPNIDLRIYTENLSQARPVLRVEIPSGNLKPYCTHGGEYRIRTDGRNRALLPEELLAIYMDREGEQFLSRFRDAVFQLEHQVENVNYSLSSGMLSVSQHLEDLDDQLRHTLHRIEQLTDSNKKRSRNLLQALRESQRSILQLEQVVVPKRGAVSSSLLEDIEHKLGMLLDLVDSDAEISDNSEGFRD